MAEQDGVECRHQGCNKTFPKPGNWKRHVETATHACSNPEKCPGCVQAAIYAIAAPWSSKLKQWKAKSGLCESLSAVHNLAATVFDSAPRSNTHTVEEAWDGAGLRRHAEAQLKSIVRSPASVRLQQKEHNGLEIFPEAFQRLLMVLVGEDRMAKQKLELIACIIGRSIEPSYVSAFCTRIGVRLHGASVEDRFRILQRLGVAPSYSYVHKVLSQCGSMVSQTRADGITFLKRRASIMTLDNVQGDKRPTHAGSGWQKKMVICTSTVARGIGEEGDDLQLQEKAPQRQTICTLPDSFKPDRTEPALPVTGASGSFANTVRGIESRASVIAKTFFALPSTPANPGKEEDVVALLREYLAMMQSTNKKWIFLAMDGSPYLIMRKLQLLSSEYDCFHLIPGPLHEEMNYLKCLAELLNALGILGFTCKLMRQTPENILKCKDTHKTIEVLTVCFTALQEAVNSHQPPPADCSPLNDLLRMCSSASSFFLAYQQFHLAVRTANLNEMISARKVFYPLLFTFGHYKYARIVADDSADLYNRRNDQAYMRLRRDATFVSISGRQDLYQGCDALQEEINRMMQNVMGGVCNAAFWTRVSVLFNKIASLIFEVDTDLCMDKTSHCKKSKPEMLLDVAQVKEHIFAWFQDIAQANAAAPCGGLDVFTEQALHYTDHAKKLAEQYVTDYYNSSESHLNRASITKLVWVKKKPRTAPAVENANATVLRSFLQDFRAPFSGTKSILRNRVLYVRTIVATGLFAEAQGMDDPKFGLISYQPTAGEKRRISQCTKCQSEVIGHPCPNTVWKAWKKDGPSLTDKWGTVGVSTPIIAQ